MLYSYTWCTELRHLRYFVAVAEEENISRVAAKLREWHNRLTPEAPEAAARAAAVVDRRALAQRR